MLCLKVCIYADPCTVEEQKQIWRMVGKNTKNKQDQGRTDVDYDQLYPAICSILPVQYSRSQLYYCNKN